MAKRARGTTSRPGQRAPLARAAGSTPPRPGSSAAATRPASLTPEEEARAAELEAQILAEEKAAEAAQRRTRSRRADGSVAMGGTIALRAAEEYRYVARDMRRITIIGGGLVAFLIGLWAVTMVTGFRFA